MLYSARILLNTLNTGVFRILACILAVFSPYLSVFKITDKYGLNTARIQARIRKTPVFSVFRRIRAEYSRNTVRFYVYNNTVVTPSSERVVALIEAQPPWCPAP